jgi:hypothetical protein
MKWLSTIVVFCLLGPTPFAKGQIQTINLPFGFTTKTSSDEAQSTLAQKGFVLHDPTYTAESPAELTFETPSGLSFSGVRILRCAVTFYKSKPYFGGQMIFVSFIGGFTPEVSQAFQNLRSVTKYFINQGFKITKNSLDNATVGKELMDRTLVSFEGEPCKIDIHSGYLQTNSTFYIDVMYVETSMLRKQANDERKATQQEDAKTQELLK